MDECARKLLLNLTVSSRATWLIYETPGCAGSKVNLKSVSEVIKLYKVKENRLIFLLC